VIVTFFDAIPVTIPGWQAVPDLMLGRPGCPRGYWGARRFVSDRQRIVSKERVGEGRNWLVKQVEIERWTRPLQRLRQGLDLLPRGLRRLPMLLVGSAVDSGRCMCASAVCCRAWPRTPIAAARRGVTPMPAAGAVARPARNGLPPGRPQRRRRVRGASTRRQTRGRARSPDPRSRPQSSLLRADRGQ
jgi:hypothetical protein